MKRLADYVFDYLADTGATHVFLMTGGHAMFLNDALARCSRLKYVCCHHEQACAMAAEAYARVAHKPAIVHITAGPGAINTLNGVFGAYTDSVPMIVISGQGKRETLVSTYNTPQLRQLGDQELDIAPMVKGITKYAVSVRDPLTIRYHLERAAHLAVSGRPGPTWLEIPVDVQATQIDPAAQKGYDPAEDPVPADAALLRRQCVEVAQRLAKAERPVILIGSGLHISGAYKEFDAVIRRLQIPVVSAWTAIDALDAEDPLYCGRAGTIGDRGGNFSVQNSDLVVVLGCRLAIRQVSYNWQSFARHAFKVQVDIDRAELEKPAMIRPDLGIQADLKDFLRTLLAELPEKSAPNRAEWLQWCKTRVAKYPIVLPRHRDTSKPINPYHFMEELFKLLGENEIVVCGNATASVVTFQAARIKRGQRVFANAGSASMGYDLPAAIGAAVARPGQRIICLGGEGSMMLNLQELQTVAHYKLPVKVIILNNDGYLSQRMTQSSFFNGLLIGEGPKSGVSFPDMVKIGKAFGLPSVRLENPAFQAALAKFLDAPGPGLANIILDRDQMFEPKLSSRRLADGRMVSAKLEDMSPFLDREELKTNLLNKEDILSCQDA
ncbi:MAG: thiamine pyrophosphate-binding protein [Verrucomicrobiota bacterium]|jgi:acetolactate synthase-1/2/3 large subunit